MCQLTLVNLNSTIFNSNYLLIQSFINSVVDNKDGFGYFSEPNNLRKTGVAPSNCYNLGTFISNIKETPVIGHVRKATFTNGVKTVSDLKSHPFQTERLVFAHNGSLELRETSPYSKRTFGDKIDSEIFLEIFDEIYEKDENKDFVSCLKSAYENFFGKFAFIIFDKVHSDYYVVRGETAKLHKKVVSANKKRVGFIVNTDSSSLDTAALLFTNLMLMKGVKLDWTDDVEELKENTIYKLDKKLNDLKIVGEIVETKRPATVPAQSAAPFPAKKYSKENTKVDDPLIQDVFNLCIEWGIDIRYLDELLYITVKKPLLGCTEEDVKFFMTEIVPEIKKHISNNNIFKEWKHFFSPSTARYNLEFHNTHLIEFPFMLESDITILRNIRKDKDAKHLVQ